MRISDWSSDVCSSDLMDHHGNRVDWSSSCDTPHGKMNATGTATYSGNTMTATTHMTGTSDDGKPNDMTQNITGKYVGACQKERSEERRVGKECFSTGRFRRSG